MAAMPAYDDQTEVLSERGWLRFSAVAPGENVATIGAHSEIQWRPVRRVLSTEHDGDVLRIRTRFVNLVVSPDVVVYVSPYNRREFERRRLADCAQMWRMTSPCRPDHPQGRWRMKRCASPQVGTTPATFDVPAVQKRYNKPVLHLGTVPIRPLLRIYGYFVSEGFITKGRAGHARGGVSLAQYIAVNPDTHHDMMVNAAALGVSPCGVEKAVIVSSRELAELLSECGESSGTKCVPGWIKALAPDLLREFFDAYMAGDGSVCPRTGQMAAQTKSTQLANDLQEIALRLGLSATLKFFPASGTHGPVWNVGFNRKKNEPRLDEAIATERYTGRLYDIDVENDVFYVRREGKPVWSGNTVGGPLNASSLDRRRRAA